MTTHALEIFEAAEKLPPMEKIELIEHLFFSLDSKGERDRIDQLWAAESEDRLSAYERGEMKSVPAAEVFGRLEASRSR